MRDKERGVIWEECIILLPKAVRFVFLSATVPNGREFASWVATIHGEPCHLIGTDHRPTPLQHWVYPQGSEGLHLLVDEHGAFHDSGWDSACLALKRGGGRAAASGLVRLMKMLVQRELTPAIVFSFSRKECEGAAAAARAVDALPDEKREAIRTVFEAAIATLSSDDQSLQQVNMLLPMLERGVAVHHSGMLPVLREVVEILFQVHARPTTPFAAFVTLLSHLASLGLCEPPLSPRPRSRSLEIGIIRRASYVCSSPQRHSRWASTCPRGPSSSPRCASGTASSSERPHPLSISR